jgi:Cu/Ag efflux pump CusA
MDERRIGTDSSGKVAARRIAQASLTACGKILGVDHLRITLGLGLVALAIMLFLALSGIVGSEFLPHLDEGAIWVRGTLAPSTGPSSSIALAKQTRLALATFPEVTQVVSQEGRPDDGSDASGFYNTEFFVDLLPHSNDVRNSRRKTISLPRWTSS